MKYHYLFFWGEAIGLLIAIPLVGPFVLGMQPDPADFARSEAIGYTAMFLGMGLIVLAVRQQRSLQGYLTMRQALLAGTIVNWFASLVVGIASYVAYAILAPEFLQTYYDYGLAQAQNDAAKLAELAQWREALLNPGFGAVLMFVTTFVIGVFMTLLAALLWRRQPAAGVPT